MQNKNLKIILLLIKQKQTNWKTWLMATRKWQIYWIIFARDIKLFSYRAYPKVTDYRMLESIMIKVFSSYLRDDRFRERVILQTPKTLTEAAQYARFSKAAVPVARGHFAPPPSTSVNAMNLFNRVHAYTALSLYLWEFPQPRPLSVPWWILSAKSDLQQRALSRTPFSFCYEKL